MTHLMGQRITKIVQSLEHKLRTDGDTSNRSLADVVIHPVDDAPALISGHKHRSVIEVTKHMRPGITILNPVILPSVVYEEIAEVSVIDIPELIDQKIMGFPLFTTNVFACQFGIFCLITKHPVFYGFVYAFDHGYGISIQYKLNKHKGFD